VASGTKPDPTQFDPKSPYYDAASKKEDPRWLLVDVQAVRKTRLLALPELRAKPELADLVVLRKGNRLSITPVDPAHWRVIEKMLA
jgi:predicted RNA-binding protein with PUA-like domain